jgi:hypothetical protein
LVIFVSGYIVGLVFFLVRNANSTEMHTEIESFYTLLVDRLLWEKNHGQSLALIGFQNVWFYAPFYPSDFIQRGLVENGAFLSRPFATISQRTLRLAP